MDEAAHHGAAVVGDLDDPEEATPETGGLVSQTILHQTDTGEPGDVGHRRGRGRRDRRQGLERSSSETIEETAETTEDRGESGREFLLLLADASVRLRAVQSVDADRATEPAGTAGAGAGRLARVRRFHGPGVLPRRGCAIPYRIPRARFDGVRQQEAGRPLPKVQVVRSRLDRVVAARSAASEPRQQSDATVSQILEDLPRVQLLLHGRVAYRLSEPVACAELDTHTVDPGPLVRLLLLLAQRSGGIPRRLGLPLPTRRVRHPHQEVPRLAVLVHPDPHHHRRSTHPGDQRRVSDNNVSTIA